MMPILIFFAGWFGVLYLLDSYTPYFKIQYVSADFELINVLLKLFIIPIGLPIALLLGRAWYKQNGPDIGGMIEERIARFLENMRSPPKPKRVVPSKESEALEEQLKKRQS